MKQGTQSAPEASAPVDSDDLTEKELCELSCFMPNLACVIDREPPRMANETRRAARQELAFLLRELARLRAGPEPTPWPGAAPNKRNLVRCPAIGPAPEHFRCGQPEGHDGNHTALSPSGMPWVSGSNSKEG